eukprot:GEMP01063432.1.p1 GENE.GEMP01063432.1~~GEMP01063432.1.p1  ORF type:complete len:269 (+),score=61.74 GEMP01063432.1:101-907(+)
MYRGSTTGRARENEFSIVRPVRQSKEPTSSSSSSGELIYGKRPFQPSRRMPLSTTSTSRPSPPIASRPSLPIASRPSRSLPSTSDLSRPIPSKTVERALLANPTHPARGSRDPIGVCAEEDPRGARREQFALEQSLESGKMLLEAVKHDKRRLQEDLAVVRARHSSDAEKWAGEMKDMESLVAQLKANKYCGASAVGERTGSAQGAMGKGGLGERSAIDSGKSQVGCCLRACTPSIDSFHARLLAGYTKIFDTHKKSYGWGHKKLVFV